MVLLVKLLAAGSPLQPSEPCMLTTTTWSSPGAASCSMAASAASCAV